jgi:iron complex transport system ATP-binding protein
VSRLEAQDVTLAYGDVAVVHRLSAAIPDGKVTSIIGPNGCGKSTLLRALARLMNPKTGTVILDGQAIHRQPTKDVARRLGLLPQQPRAPEAITVQDLVQRGRYPHQSMFQPPTDSDQVAVERALELANVTDLRERVVDELSGGQRQRAWIAMTLAQETSLLLLDEPTTFLDVAHQLDVLELVTRLNRDEGKTVVMVLHDLNQASHFSDHVIALRDGEIVAQGTPGEAITQERIEAVFGVQTEVVRQPRSGNAIFVPRFERAAPGSQVDGTASAGMQARDLVLAYGRRVVVEGASVAFPHGAISAIVGPNACGKSTLFRSLARLLSPRSGEVSLEGKPIGRGSRRRLAQDVALLSQSPTAPPEVTVEELVAGGRYPHQRWWRQWSEADELAIDAALSSTDLTELPT